MELKALFERSDHVCPVCGLSDMQLFLEITNVPASCNQLWMEKEAAMSCPKGDIRLAFCPNCESVLNIALEPKKNQYTQMYENSLFFSGFYRDFAESLARDLVERYDLHGKDIIEIGCGKGEFLQLLCELGNNRGTGFDPTYSHIRERSTAGKNLAFIAGVYSPEHKDIQADMIFSWHVLEHMNDPVQFITQLRDTIEEKRKTRLFFGVPNFLSVVEKGHFLDIIYEHVSYFTTRSLSALFSRCGFTVCETGQIHRENSLYIDACLSQEPCNSHFPSSDTGAYSSRDLINRFFLNHRRKLEECSALVSKMKELSGRAVVWGAGSRGVTFLNAFEELGVEFAVDINPRKQGKFVPGTGQKIVPPDFLKEYKPRFVIVVNPMYEVEIRQQLERLNIETQMVVV